MLPLAHPRRSGADSWTLRSQDTQERPRTSRLKSDVLSSSPLSSHMWLDFPGAPLPFSFHEDQRWHWWSNQFPQASGSWRPTLRHGSPAGWIPGGSEPQSHTPLTHLTWGPEQRASWALRAKPVSTTHGPSRRRWARCGRSLGLLLLVCMVRRVLTLEYMRIIPTSRDYCQDKRIHGSTAFSTALGPSECSINMRCSWSSLWASSPLTVKHGHDSTNLMELLSGIREWVHMSPWWHGLAPSKYTIMFNYFYLFTY